jgi:uncharacterized protein
MKKWLVWLLMAVYMVIGTVASAAPTIPPAPAASIYVQDYAGVLSAETKAKINTLGAKISRQTKAQVVVVTVNSLNEEPIQDYSLAMLRQWKIGDKSLNNGVLLLVAVGDRKSRIEVGYGLEGALNDAKVGQIQDEYLIPYAGRGNYDQGIWNSYKAIMRVVSAEYGIVAPQDARGTAKISGDLVPAWWDGLPWWGQGAAVVGFFLLFIADWLLFGGSITFLLLSLLRLRGSGGGGYGGGSGGGGGADRRW